MKYFLLVFLFLLMLPGSVLSTDRGRRMKLFALESDECDWNRI